VCALICQSHGTISLASSAGNSIFSFFPSSVSLCCPLDRAPWDPSSYHDVNPKQEAHFKKSEKKNAEKDTCGGGYHITNIHASFSLTDLCFEFTKIPFTMRKQSEAAKSAGNLYNLIT